MGIIPEVATGMETAAEQPPLVESIGRKDDGAGKD
jgi:hypothetical protein